MCESMAMHCSGFRPGSQKEASVQGCLRTHDTTEHFNHHTAGGMRERVQARKGKRETFYSLQLRVMRVNMVTFCLYRRLSPSIIRTGTVSSLQRYTRPLVNKSTGGCAYSNLDFLSVELSLDGSKSSQLSKLDKKRKRLMRDKM